MKYKLIVLDLDDTLVHPSGQVSRANQWALMRAQKLGVRVVLASGRPVYAMRAIAKLLQLKEYDGYMLSFNGAYVVSNKTRQPAFSAGLSKPEVKALHGFAQQEGVFIHTYTATEILTPQNNQYTEVERFITGMPVVECQDFLAEIPQQVSKVLLLADPKKLQTAKEKLSGQMGDEFSIAISKPFFLEVTAPGVDKGTSLLRLCETLGIDPAETLAIGDSYNDVPMLKVAGLSVAMGNAPDEIKQQADYITATCQEDGVARAIEKFVLDRELPNGD